jgi:hypothetical protein
VSYASRKGYRAEADGLTWLQQNLPVRLERPRAGAAADRGDYTGAPLVISVKDWDTPSLGSWVDALPRMIAAAGLETGVVLHKRRGKGSPDDWFVTTSGRLWLPLAAAYGQGRSAPR